MAQTLIIPLKGPVAGVFEKITRSVRAIVTLGCLLRKLFHETENVQTLGVLDPKFAEKHVSEVGLFVRDF